MKYLVIVTFFLISLTSCHQKAMTDDTHNHDADDHSHDEGVIELSPEQMRNVGIAFERIEKRAIRSLIKLSGRVELPPNGMAVASSPIGGRIIDVLVEPGQSVKKGQRLFSVFNLELIDWQKEYLQHLVDLKFLEKEVERQKSLRGEKLSAEKELQEAISKYEYKEFEFKAMERKLETLGVSVEPGPKELLDHFYVVATQAGRVEHVNINSGAYVEPTANLVEIINDDHLHLHLLAYGRQSDLLQEKQSLLFNVLSRPNDVRTAKIKWINNVVNEENNSYDIHAEIIGNEQGLIAGEFVEARILSSLDSLETLPAEAITYDRGLEYVFVLDGADSGGTHFRKVQIQTGVEDLGFVEVKPVDELTRSDQVVVGGAFFLMAETKKQEMGEVGHSHAH